MLNLNQVLKVVTAAGKTIYNHRRSIARVIAISAGAGAVYYACSKAPETVHAVEDAGNEKGQPLTKMETAKIVVKKQWPAIALGTVAVSSVVGIDITASREMHDMKLTNASLKSENKGLVEQVAEMATAYNTVNTVKEAMSKKVEETHGKEITQQIVNESTIEAAPKPINDTNDMVYVANPRRINDWNDIYFRTGDENYKVQEYTMPFTGQRFMSCPAHVDQAIHGFKKRIDEDFDRGFATLNEFCDEVGCKTSEVGNYFIWRKNSDYFDAYVCPDNGKVARMLIMFTNDPYYDYRHEY